MFKLNFIFLASILFCMSCGNKNNTNTNTHSAPAIDTTISVRYTDTVNHMTIDYPKTWSSRTDLGEVIPIGFFEPVDTNDNFSENVIIAEEKMPLSISREEYTKATKTQLNLMLKEVKIKTESVEEINGTKWTKMDYSHVMDGKKYEVLLLLNTVGKTGFAITCSAPENTFEAHKTVFNSILNSIHFN